MTADQVKQSYEIDHAWSKMWEYTFGLYEYPKEELEVLSLLYDACMAELDALFESLIAGLAERGLLENTIVVLTSDHGEHLGEHHMLDHMYLLHEELLDVPLVLHYPERIERGREKIPVVNIDLFPTLLELAGIDVPAGALARSVSLLSPRVNRLRLAEYPSVFELPIKKTKARYKDWDASRFDRLLTVLYHDDMKFVWSSDGKHEMYDLAQDPDEAENLASDPSQKGEEMKKAVEQAKDGLTPYDYEGAEKPRFTKEQLMRLRALGYAGGN
jgi:arylsulfatase A-like enzyme